ncbi:MAG: NosD domain-containing protein, partial [Candidatus Bipolaricaulis sp.]|nr:NosD domain-containing protein [Candidatus Bipolaricaulis sp.]
MAPISRKRMVVVLALLVVVLGVGTTLVVRHPLFPPERIPRDAIVVPRDVATLDAALDRVAAGGTILLDTRNGAILGPLVINVPRITIRAFGRAAEIVAEGSAPAISVRADDVTLRRLDVRADGVGILVAAARCRISETTVRDTPTAVRLSGARHGVLDRMTVEGGDVALEIVSSSETTVRSATIRNSAEVGVRVVASWNNALERLEVARAPIGIALEEGSRQTRLAGCRVSDCDVAAVVVRGSTDVTVDGSVFRRTPVGVALERTSGCEIHNCTIEETAAAGVVLEESVQNRVLDSVIRASRGAGVRATGSAQNTLSGNTIRGGAGPAILLRASDRTLVMGNNIADVGIGIRSDAASSCRVLRNCIAADRVGLLLEGGETNHVLDNHVSGGELGISAVSTVGNTILRNRITGSAGSGIAALGDSANNTVSQNTVLRSGVGILIEATADSAILDNRAVQNDVGVLLVRPGAGLRLEGNRLVRNRIGLQQADSASDALTGVAALGGPQTAAGRHEEATPLLAHNAFVGSRVRDIQNDAPRLLYAAGNRWQDSDGDRSAAMPRVSTGVSLDESAWRGTVAIGADTSELQAVVGHILKRALTRAGYRVVSLIGIQDPRRVEEALQAADVDLVYRELPAGDVYGVDSSFRPFVFPARAGWLAAVPASLADRLPKRNLSALSALSSTLAEAGETLLWAVPDAYGAAAVASLRDAYSFGRTTRAVVWAKTLEEAESLLTLGAVQLALVGNLEEAVTSSEFVTLDDDRQAMTSRNVTVLVRLERLREHPEIDDVLARLASRLTTSVLRDLMNRARLSERSPEEIAVEFLLGQGL